MKSTRWLTAVLVTLSLVVPRVASAQQYEGKLKYYPSPSEYCLGDCSGKGCCDTPEPL